MVVLTQCITRTIYTAVSSGGHLGSSKVIRRSLGGHQGHQWSSGIIRRSSVGHQEIIRRSSGDHQEVIRGSSGGHQGIIRRSSEVTRRWARPIHIGCCCTIPAYFQNKFLAVCPFQHQMNQILMFNHRLTNCDLSHKIVTKVTIHFNEEMRPFFKRQTDFLKLTPTHWMHVCS